MPKSNSNSLTTEDVKAALRRRHPAFAPDIQGVGRWTLIEEWRGVDLLALDAWRAGEVVGYEVKVSRGDMRSELLNPSKRSEAVNICTRFYFATPAGLLTPEERAWEEPEWEPSDFVRQRCTNPRCSARLEHRGWYRNSPKPRGSKLRGTTREGVSIHLGYHTDRGQDPHGGTYTNHMVIEACCVICKGYGTVGRSRVEQDAPTLWIPRDVGLVSVGPRGCSVLREAPRRKVTEPIIPWPFIGYRRADGSRRRRISEEDASRLERAALNQFARWVSYRPDPRHAARRGEGLSMTTDAEPVLEEQDFPGGVQLG